MKAYFKILIIIVCQCALVSRVYSQTKPPHCGTDEAYRQRLIENPGILENEKRINNIINELVNDTSNGNQKTTTLIGVKKIPVVFHLIGDDVFSIINMGVLLNQINVLNNVYRRKLATTGYGTGVDVEVEFCLAKKDPEGNNSNGYVFVNGSYPDFVAGSNSMKLLSNWPSDKYLNVWIVSNITNPVGTIIGYSTFPWEFSVSPEFDGIVLHKNYVYSFSDPQVQGKNLAHEVGHWLGIKHPFTDDNSCGDNDECLDTPDANGQYYTGYIGPCLPLPPGDSLFCPIASRQIENYMEYTSETCKNKFTACQKTKMRNYLENVRSSVYDPTNVSACDYIADNSNTNDAGTEFCKDCCPRTEYLNISGGLKGSTSGAARELIASNIKAGGSGYYMTPATTGKVKLIADTRVTSTGAAYYGSITLIDGFYYYADNDTEIEFFLCDLKSEMTHIDVISECKRCGKFTVEPNPVDNDRNKRIANRDTIHGVYIKPPTQNNQQQSVLLKDLNINVFPNPSSNGFFNVFDVLNSNTFLNYKVINAIGTVVLQGEFTNTVQINLNNLAHGIYQIIIYNAYNTVLKTLSYN